MESLRLLSIILVISIFSCKDKKKIVENSPEAQEYLQFINSQKEFKLSNNHSIKYIDEGSHKTKTILLVHGVPTSSWLYRKMIPQLVEKGYRVIAPDMLGYGQSDMPNGYDLYLPKAMSGYLLELMDGLNISTWENLCHDAGSLWTWEALKIDSISQKISRLYILNSIMFKDGFNPPIQMKRNWFSKTYVKSYSSSLLRKGTMKTTIKNGLSQKKMCTPSMLYGYTAPSLERLDHALYSFFSNTCVEDLEDFEPLFKRLKTPIKVVWGAQDKILDWAKQQDKVKKALKLQDGDILILQNAKHFIQEERPKKIVDFITN